MAEKIVLVTAGGHIASFHAAMVRMHETLEKKAKNKFELFGAWGGLSGLINGNIVPIRYSHLEEDKAGSLIGSDRAIAETEKISKAVKDNKIYAVIMMGGDNHLGEADKCHDIGLPFVGYPKTMDGDLSSFITLGWETAVSQGSRFTRYHHNSAITTRRVFYVGLFGRNTDWVVTGVSAYGGADVTIPCEKKYSFDYVWDKICLAVEKNKEKYQVPFAVVPYSEGALLDEFNEVPVQYKSVDKHNEVKLIPEIIGLELVRLTKAKGMSSSFESHTYSLRDVPPTKTDKRLSKMAGEECIDMVIDGDFGKCAVFEPEGKFFKTSRLPLGDVAVQRRVKDTNFFDYDLLRANESFIDIYKNLFKDSLGSPPNKNELVYKNLL